jgi:peptidoglycan hydrolase-like protein with peptidoglycan-binding domain
MLALAAMPAIALAQDSSNAGGQRQSAPQTAADSNRAMQAQTQGATSEAKPAVMPARQQSASSQGRRSSSSRGASTGTLSRENIAQLQMALSENGCDAGTADGIMGPRTRRALACARQKNNVSSDAELYQSLNLGFAPSTGAVNSSGRNDSNAHASGNANSALPRQNSQGMSTDAAGAHATHGDSAQVGGTNRGRIYPPADSVRKSTTTPPRRD